MLIIQTVPNPFLRTLSHAVEKTDKKLLQFIKDLSDTLVKKTDPPGVGISAVQVGNPIQVFLTYLPPNPSNDTKTPANEPVLKTYLNPKIVTASKAITLGDNPQKPLMEGCLSIPRLWGPVWRHQEIEVEYQTLNRNNNLETYQEKLTGFAARVFQHEYDHLQGVLFTDYVLGSSPAKNFNPLGKPQALYFEEEDEFVKIEKPQAILTW